MDCFICSHLLVSHLPSFRRGQGIPEDRLLPLALNKRIRFYAKRAAIREQSIILGFVGKTVKTFT